MTYQQEQGPGFLTQGAATAGGETVKDLQQAIEMLRGTLDGAPDLIAVEDTASHYLAFNRAYHAEFKKVFGVDLKIGSSMIESLAHLPEEQKAAVAIFERTMRGEDFTVTREFGDEQLVRRYYELHCFPIRDSAGRVIGGSHIARDVTEQRRAEEALRASEENYRRIIESSMDCIKMLDLEGHLLSINPVGQRLMELEDLRGYLGHVWLDGWQGDDLRHATEALERARAGEVGRFRALGTTTKGTPKWWEVTVSPILDTDGRPERLLIIARDITEQKKAEDEVRGSEERFKLAQQAGHVGVFDWDIITDRAIITGELESIFGLEPGAEGGTYENWARHVFPEDMARINQEFQQCLQARKRQTEHEYHIVRPDGQVRWVEVKGQISYLDNGRPARMIGTIVDITERKNAEEALRESEGKFRALAENAHACFGIVQGQRFVYANPYFAQMSGYSVEELLTLDFPTLVHPDFKPLMEERARRRQMGEAVPSHYEFAMLNKSGEKRWVEFSVGTIEYRGKPAIIGTGFDITARKEAEEALKLRNEQLADADRRKNEFLAMLAHELRNPLAPIRNAMQVLRLVDMQEPTQQRQGDIIDRQISHMARLLNDLLDVSRITRGKVELHRQPLALVDVLTHAVETARPLTEARHHTLTVSSPSPNLRVLADLDRMAQVVGNLLTNSAKYTEEGGRIWLDATRNGGQAVIRVRDTGVGIAPELLPHIFDLFTQADQTLGRSQGGLGIGLTMVRNLVQMHGGSVEAHSAGLGQGSEFVIRLPALAETAPPAATPPDPPRAAANETASRRVLVVDDIADTAQSLCELLALWGHQVRVVYDGAGALEAARAFNPEVVLLDIGLPDMDGYEVARRLRQEAGGDKVILLALTGYGQASDKEQSSGAGFNHHLIKPVDLEILKKLLDSSANRS